MTPRLTLVTAPVVEPVTVQEMKDDRRIMHDAEDALIDLYLAMARRAVEQRSGLALLTQTWEAAYDGWPCATDTNPWGGFILPRPPLQSITSIKYIDTAGVEQTLATSEYTVNTRAFPGEVVPAYGKSWPAIRGVPNAIVVRFVAGFGATAETVPETLRDAVRLEAADRYVYRLDQSTDTLVSRGAVARLLANEMAYVV